MPELPPLPERMRRWVVERSDKTQTVVVTIGDAARLMNMRKAEMEVWIEKGRVVICYDPKGRVRVLVDSLLEETA